MRYLVARIAALSILSAIISLIVRIIFAPPVYHEFVVQRTIGETIGSFFPPFLLALIVAFIARFAFTSASARDKSTGLIAATITVVLFTLFSVVGLIVQ